MELTYPIEAEVFRERIHSLLGANLPPGWRGLGALGSDERDAFVAKWRDVLANEGLLAVAWPKAYGGAGLTPLEQIVLAEEFARAGVPSGTLSDVVGIQLLGNTLLACGTDEQKRTFLPRILSGEDRWCQGFSEPEAGSDLASLRTRARLEGDEWIIDGQKVWTSAAQAANWIFVLCRTDPDAPKHKGITFLLCPMDQPGIEVRPIKMMSGQSEFCEVFLSDVRTPRHNVVGGINQGWNVAMTTLGYERGEIAATLPIRFREEFDRLLTLARQSGRLSPPLRDRLAASFARLEVMRYLGLRSVTRFIHGEPPGTEGSLFKLYWSQYHQDLTNLAMDILGAEATTPEGRAPHGAFQTDDPGSPNSSASWAGTFLNGRAGTIYAGTSEVQRTIIGERTLGLPKP